MRNLSTSNHEPEYQSPTRLTQSRLFRHQLLNQTEPNTNEIQQCNELIHNLINYNQSVSTVYQNIDQHILHQQYSTGIGFYNARNLVMLRYTILLQLYQMFKIYGQDLTSGQGLSIYEELVYNKILLLKIGSTEKKLEYQTNKILKSQTKTAVKPQLNYKTTINEQNLQQESDASGSSKFAQQQDILAYQPRIDKLVVTGNNKSKKKTQQKYIPPKLSSALTKEDKRKQSIQRQKQRKKAFLLRKFKDDILEQGQQAQEKGFEQGINLKLKQKFEQKTRIQEDNFMRFRQTKKQKSWRKQLMKQHQRSSQLGNDLKEIQMIRELFEEQQNQQSTIPSKKVKTGTNRTGTSRTGTSRTGTNRTGTNRTSKSARKTNHN